MTAITTGSPAATRSCRMRRIDRSTVILTGLGVASALLVLLPMLPGAAVPDHSITVDEFVSMGTLPLFIGGAMISVLFIGVVLLRATRRSTT